MKLLHFLVGFINLTKWGKIPGVMDQKATKSGLWGSCEVDWKDDVISVNRCEMPFVEMLKKNARKN